MSKQDRGISPNPFDKEFRPTGIIEVERANFLEPDELKGIKGVPQAFASAIRGLAGEPFVKGLAVIAVEDEIFLRVIHDSTKDKVASARISLHELNLRMLGLDVDYANVDGKPFEEIVESMRQEVARRGNSRLAGTIKFTD